MPARLVGWLLLLIAVVVSQQQQQQQQSEPQGNTELDGVTVYKVQVPSGSLQIGIGDGKLAPVVTSLAPESPVGNSLHVGDILIAVDDVMTFKLLAFHVASLITARSEANRTLYVLPAADDLATRTNVTAIHPRDMAFLKQGLPERPPGLVAPAKPPQMRLQLGQIDVEQPRYFARPRVVYPGGFDTFSTTETGESAAVHAQVDQNGNALPVSMACLETPSMLMLSSVVQKLGLADRTLQILTDYSNTNMFCQMQTTPLVSAALAQVLGCDHLWNNAHDCGAIKQQLRRELHDFQQHSTSDLINLGNKAVVSRIPGFWIVPLTIAAIIAIIWWVILIVCAYADCIQLILSCSDNRLKQSIVSLGLDGRGVGWYEFEYTPFARNELGCGQGRNGLLKHRGVMAQDLLELGGAFAESVSLHKGYYWVDYAHLATI